MMESATHGTSSCDFVPLLNSMCFLTHHALIERPQGLTLSKAVWIDCCLPFGCVRMCWFQNWCSGLVPWRSIQSRAPSRILSWCSRMWTYAKSSTLSRRAWKKLIRF